MAFSGFQLNKVNANATAVTIANNAAVLFDAAQLYPTPDQTISYASATGIFTFSESNSYFIYWNVNLQSSPDLDAKFKIVVSDEAEENPTIKEYPASSIFKTGQLTGSALIEVDPNSTMKLVNTGGSTVTLAIGAGVITAGISIFTVSGISDYSGVQGYLSNATDSVATDAMIPFDTQSENSTAVGITLDTTTAKGEVTITRHGTYTVDWTLAVNGAESASEIVISIIDNTDPNPVTLATHYSPVVSGAFVSGTAIINVSEAQATTAGGYKFAVYNKTASALALAAITQRGSIRITGAN